MFRLRMALLIATLNLLMAGSAMLVGMLPASITEKPECLLNQTP